MGLNSKHTIVQQLLLLLFTLVSISQSEKLYNTNNINNIQNVRWSNVSENDRSGRLGLGPGLGPSSNSRGKFAGMKSQLYQQVILQQRGGSSEPSHDGNTSSLTTHQNNSANDNVNDINDDDHDDDGHDDDDNHDEQWRTNLPSQLQQRRGSLHRIIIPTGFKKTSNVNQESSSSLSSSGTTTPAATSIQSQEDVVCEVYLLGTAHVSKDSCEDVKLLMNAIKPDVLFVELCNQRIAILEEDEEDDSDNMTLNSSSSIRNDNNNNTNTENEEEEKKSVSQLTKEIMMHNPDMSRTAAMSSVLLSKIQGDYATKLGVKIGGEFQQAYNMAKLQQKEYLQEAQRLQWSQQLSNYQRSSHHDSNDNNSRSLHGCAVVLGDRPVRLTLLRTWESLSLFGKFKLICGLIWSSLKQPNEKELKEWIESIMNDPTNDILSKSMEELSRHFPTVKETIIAERDTYMSCKLLQIAKLFGEVSSRDGQVRRIVAVVGAGHCPGIRKALAESHNIESTGIEDTLRSVVETKKYKIDGSPDMASLITDIASIEI